MANLKDYYQQIVDWGGEVFGVAVDSCEESARMKKQLELPFEILSDTDKEVIKELQILNSKERGGIAYPNIYILDNKMEIIFRSCDKLFTRANPHAILDFLDQYEKNDNYRLENKKRKFAKQSISDLILSLPRKLNWVK